MRDQATGRARAFAFLEMQSEDDALRHAPWTSVVWWCVLILSVTALAAGVFGSLWPR